MGILDFNSAPANTTATARRSTSNADLPQAKVWLNVGYEANGKFVNLPFGIALDTMQPLPVKGQSEDWVKLRTAQNHLLKQLQAGGDALDSGEEIVVNLQVRMRKTKEDLVVAADESNEFVADLGGLFSKLEPVEAAE